MALITDIVSNFVESLESFVHDDYTKELAQKAKEYGTQYLNSDLSLTEYLDILNDFSILKQLSEIEKETALYVFGSNLYSFIQECKSFL